MTGIRLSVIDAWHPADRKPLVLHEGDKVKVGHHDTEWTAYRWCTGGDETSGWVPLDYLVIDDYGDGTVTVDYSTVELAVEIGAVVAGYQSAGSWTWCVADNGSAGWVPNRALSRLT